MSRRITFLGFVVGLVVLISAVSTPVAAQELSVDNVNIPNSVTTDESFDIEVDVTTEDINQEGVDVTLGLPNQLTCSPSGTQTVSEDGSETATFSCDADAPGDYTGEIDVTVSGTTTDGDSISDSTTTGLIVNSPASLSMTTSVDSNSIDEGDSTTLTVSVSNTGDVSTTYTLSVSPDSGLSESLDSGTESDSVGGGNTKFVTYTLTGDSNGDQDATVTLNGGNGQQLTEVETVSVTGDSGGGGGGGGGTSSSTATEPEVIQNPETAIKNPPTDIEPKRAEQAQIAVDEETGQARVTFTEESTIESITFENDDVEGDVTVAEYDSEPEETGPTPGLSVAVTQIEVPDPDQSATIRKRISTDRLEGIDADAEDLRINRFNDEAGEWQALETEAVETTDERVVLEAETPGFSFFSVSAVSEPAATIAAPEEVEVGEEFTLDASDSSDEYGEVVAYEWRIGGETLTGETVTTVIDSAGEATVELTVENDAGETTTTSTTVTVIEPETEDDTEATDDDAESDDTEGTDETDAESEPDEDTEDLDGFEVAIALVALLAAALLARRRT